jgi:molybdopterin-guanine dinucleotide biosynthesis protein MobB
MFAVVGGKHSGKTTTIEALVKELSTRDYRVAAVKHVSEQSLALDTKGKDTWRYARAGASVILGVAAQEVVTIEKVNTEKLSIKEILERIGSCDIVILEGFKESVKNKKDIAKIVAVKSNEEALEAKKMFSPIMAFTGPNSVEQLSLKTPYVNVLKDIGRLADLVEEVIRGA